MIGVASAAFCYFLMLHFHQGAADFGWAVAPLSTCWPDKILTTLLSNNIP